MPPIYIVCGPTASGKSAFGLQLARNLGGIIINADALQIYKGLETITCSPSKEELATCQHHLYNHLSVFESYNVFKYLQQAVEIISQETKPIVIIGGTGFYIQALTKGVHLMPDIDPALRSELRSIENTQQLYKMLIELDPARASELKASDTQRILRSLEVVMQTGKGITHFHSEKGLYHPLKGYDIKTILLMPEREFLYRTCNERFEKLVRSGALEEARSLLEVWDSMEVSPKKALGLAELIAHLKGALSLQDAVRLAQQKTRNFAKRQITWFRHQIQAQHTIHFTNADELFKHLLLF